MNSSELFLSDSSSLKSILLVFSCISEPYRSVSRSAPWPLRSGHHNKAIHWPGLCSVFPQASLAFVIKGFLRWAARSEGRDPGSEPGLPTNPGGAAGAAAAAAQGQNVPEKLWTHKSYDGLAHSLRDVCHEGRLCAPPRGCEGPRSVPNPDRDPLIGYPLFPAWAEVRCSESFVIEKAAEKCQRLIEVGGIVWLKGT